DRLICRRSLRRSLSSGRGMPAAEPRLPLTGPFVRRKVDDMVRRDSGPRRSESIDAYLRGTRALAAVALLALVSGVLWDALDGRFWARHALLGGLVASVIVVMLTVGLVNEASS